MKILLLSDTHGHMDERILSYASEADEVWHAGDIGDLSVCNQLSAVSKLRAVYGNIDNAEIRKEFPLNNRFLVDNTDVWITHIGGYPGKYSQPVRVEINSNPPKIFVCGHSHILKVMFDKELNLLHLNPGACGKQGFHQIRTMLRFELSDGSPQKMEVIELERR
ncbi:MAG: metallophosphoesterase family protein [Weeksellaceae bacterium]|nr:metallophosphoesterase family protein [Weeksellaceae bacterium]